MIEEVSNPSDLWRALRAYGLVEDRSGLDGHYPTPWEGDRRKK